MTGNILARQWRPRLGTSTDEAIRIPILIVAPQPLADQLDRCRRRHAEPAGRASTAHPLNFHSPNDAKTKIRRERFGHAGWPPLPAPMMNHDLPRKGIPSDSARSENALAEVWLRNHDGEGARRSNEGSLARWPPKRSVYKLAHHEAYPWADSIACLPLMSCAAGSRTIGETAADTLPTWLGSESKGLPPRSGAPVYDAWMAKHAQQATEPQDKE